MEPEEIKNEFHIPDKHNFCPKVFVRTLELFNEYENSLLDRRIEILEEIEYFAQMDRRHIIFSQLYPTKEEKELKERKKQVAQSWGI